MRGDIYVAGTGACLGQEVTVDTAIAEGLYDATRPSGPNVTPRLSPPRLPGTAWPAVRCLPKLRVRYRGVTPGVQPCLRSWNHRDQAATAGPCFL